jgi:hypothetical protein
LIQPQARNCRLTHNRVPNSSSERRKSSARQRAMPVQSRDPDVHRKALK